MRRLLGPALIALALAGATSAQAATEGALVQLSGDAGVAAAPGATGVSISPGGGNVYSVASGALVTYSRDAVSGALTPLTAQGALTHPPEVAPVVSPDGRNAYGGSAVLARDVVSGVLTDAGTAPGTGASVLGATAVSPDGLSVYVAAPDDGTIFAFARDALTGALTATGATTTAQDINALALSPDGRSLYASSATSLAVFTRDPLTGALTAAGCFDDVGANGCTAVPGLHGPTDVAVSPGGGNVYVTAGDSGAGGVVVLARDAGTGALTPLSGSAGCISESDAACTFNDTVTNAHAIVIAPDGRFAYVASFDGALVSLTRDVTTGALTAIAAPDGCLTDVRFGASSCGTGRALWELNGLALSPDGLNVYGSASDQGLSAFRRSPLVVVDPPPATTTDPGNTDPKPQIPAPVVSSNPTPVPAPAGAGRPVRVIVETPQVQPDVTPAPTLKLLNQTGVRGFRTGKLRIVVRCDRACSGIVSAYAKPKKGKTARLAGKRVKLKRKGDLVVNFVVKGANLKLLNKSGTTLLFRARAA